ncbi:MAG: PDR/VanB family oxidoreductase [Alphaproteobacteria bacterium]
MFARLRQIRWEAENVRSFVLEPLAGGVLPPFAAGAHVDVRLAKNLTRSSSLLNDPAEKDRYELGVLLEPEGRGGSRHVHERWRAGDEITVSPPINDFRLDETAPHSVLIAGGIGVTPILAMIARLEALGRSWELHYVSRTRRRAAFLDRIAGFGQARAYFDQEPGGEPLDLAAVVGAAPADAHLYCCGPAGMLDAFERLTEGRAHETVHIERFVAAPPPGPVGGFRLRLKRSGRTVQVAPGQTMLAALLDAGVDVLYACQTGMCGTCETRVLSGAPDHRGEYLTDAERLSNTTVLVCCSGSRTEELELDL